MFNVPNDLLVVKPKAYTPQSVSIGPYHRSTSELYYMECYKVAVARRFQKRINGQKFESVVVKEFKKHECKGKRDTLYLLRLVCQELSPFTFKLPEDSKIHTIERGHILEVLYYAIVTIPNIDGPNIPNEDEKEEVVPGEMSTINRAFRLLWTALTYLNIRPIRFLMQLAQKVLNE
eukprot:PITA_03099